MAIEGYLIPQFNLSNANIYTLEVHCYLQVQNLTKNLIKKVLTKESYINYHTCKESAERGRVKTLPPSTTTVF